MANHQLFLQAVSLVIYLQNVLWWARFMRFVPHFCSRSFLHLSFGFPFLRLSILGVHSVMFLAHLSLSILPTDPSCIMYSVTDDISNSSSLFYLLIPYFVQSGDVENWSYLSFDTSINFVPKLSCSMINLCFFITRLRCSSSSAS